ncbi:hypothetical protein P5673_020181, partial [Acropora cervicornis]
KLIKRKQALKESTSISDADKHKFKKEDLKSLGTSGPHRGNPASKKHEFPLQNRMMKLLKDETLNFFPLLEERTLSSATYSNLVRDTFQMRRKFITQEANSSKEILNVYPYLGKPSHPMTPPDKMFRDKRIEFFSVMSRFLYTQRHSFPISDKSEATTNFIVLLIQLHGDSITLPAVF